MYEKKMVKCDINVFCNFIGGCGVKDGDIKKDITTQNKPIGLEESVLKIEKDILLALNEKMGGIPMRNLLRTQ